MGRIEKTVFISYRRANLPWALAIYQDLAHHGYDVFFDYQSIDSGDFEKVIIENIKARAHFLVILTPSAMERCNEPDDWLRREIEIALDEKRNIVPLMLEGFDFGNPSISKHLTGKLALITNYNGLVVPAEYFLEAMGYLRNRFLSTDLAFEVKRVSNDTEQIMKIINDMQEKLSKLFEENKFLEQKVLEIEEENKQFSTDQDDTEDIQSINGLTVFLCHSSGDKQKVRELYSKLVRNGVDAWLDEEKIVGGQNWEPEIKKAVRSSQVVAVCLSKETINKVGFVQKEIKFALDVASEQPPDSIFIIPVKLEECDVPEQLLHLQWVNFYEDNGYKKLIAALVKRAYQIKKSN